MNDIYKVLSVILLLIAAVFSAFGFILLDKRNFYPSERMKNEWFKQTLILLEIMIPYIVLKVDNLLIALKD